ncbi:transporter substrate-binding domain-containing protein [Cupriavidus basilensis]|uniref:transporter substrate-binding domain-containing protein n=1 Tax=Cupriavidus basilensis TaxID=68895 RepID=UPI0039F6FA48
MKSIIKVATVVFVTLAAQAHADESTMEKVARTKAVTIGFAKSSAPLSYVDDKGNAAGYMVALCKRLAQALQSKLELKKLAVKTVLQTRGPGLVDGETDLYCGAMVQSAAARKALAFSYVTYVSETRFVTPRDLGVRFAVDLNGKTVAVAGKDDARLIERFNKVYSVNLQSSSSETLPDAFQKLAEGQAVGIVADDYSLANLIARSSQPDGYAYTGEAIFRTPIAIAMRQDGELEAFVNQTLGQMMASGEIAQIYSRWFESKIPSVKASINLPASDATKAAWARPNDDGPAAYRASLTDDPFKVQAPPSVAQQQTYTTPAPPDDEPAENSSGKGNGLLGMLGAVAKGMAGAGTKNSANLAMVGNALQGNSSSAIQGSGSAVPSNRSTGQVAARNPAAATPQAGYGGPAGTSNANLSTNGLTSVAPADGRGGSGGSAASKAPEHWVSVASSSDCVRFDTTSNKTFMFLVNSCGYRVAVSFCFTGAGVQSGDCAKNDIGLEYVGPHGRSTIAGPMMAVKGTYREHWIACKDPAGAKATGNAGGLSGECRRWQ